MDSGWLMNAPQAKLPGYNPLVMSKVYLLRDAARANYWGARYHLWMDAGHFCAVEQNPTQTSVFREHMSRGFLVTHWPYGTATEVCIVLISLFLNCFYPFLDFRPYTYFQLP